MINSEILYIFICIFILYMIDSTNANENTYNTIQYNNYIQFILFIMAYYIGYKVNSHIVSILLVMSVVLLILFAHLAEMNNAISNMYILNNIEKFTQKR